MFLVVCPIWILVITVVRNHGVLWIILPIFALVVVPPGCDITGLCVGGKEHAIGDQLGSDHVHMAGPTPGARDGVAGRQTGVDAGAEAGPAASAQGP